MRAQTIILTTSAIFALSIGVAEAGQCTSEIDSLSKVLAAKDAGSGPTSTGSVTSGQHPPTTAMSQADQETTASRAAAESSKPQHPPTIAMNKEAAGAHASAADQPARQQHPPTAAMNQATAGTAASGQDAQRQTAGQPTAAQRAQGALPGGRDVASASAALNRARGFDASGQEAQCIDAVRQAKQLLDRG